MGLCQTNVSKDKATSFANARASIVEAVGKGAELVVLGEMFSCPYATKYFREYGERLSLPAGEHNPSVKFLAELAAEHKIWLIGGSIPELEDDKVYNTCLVFSPDGAIAAKHRKAHLFDIDVAATETRPAIKFKESDVLTGGDKLSFVDLPWCRAGIGICYDVRFPEYALALRNQGAKLLVYPGCFNTTTGPAHWSILAQGRAVDTQSYVALVSLARSADTTEYQAYGHSMLVDPWGAIQSEAGTLPQVEVVDIDPAEADRIRGQVPTSCQKRTDLYVPYADLAAEKRRKICD